MYKCYICGRTYNSPVDAANCTISCSKKAENANIQKELQELREKIAVTYKSLKTLCENYNNLSKTENFVITCRQVEKPIYISQINDNIEFLNTSISSPKDETTKIYSCIVNDK